MVGVVFEYSATIFHVTILDIFYEETDFQKSFYMLFVISYYS